MRAYILSIGSELVLGQLTDTNATFLAQELAAAGIDLIHVTHVGDDRQQLADAIRHALTLADFVICSGGIGPTDDDLTREAIADVLVETPSIDPDLFRDLHEFFSGRGQVMPERNAKQAWTIPSADVLPNPVGTAPGWFVTAGKDDPRIIVTMPGVPREMFRMWKEQALPRLQALAGQQIIDSTIIKTIGIGESAAEQIIHELVRAADPVVATYAKDDGVHVRVTAVGNDAAETRSRRDAGEAAVRELLGPYIWGADNDSLASIIADALSGQGANLGIIEYGTGGGFTVLLARDPASAPFVAEASILPLNFDLTEESAANAALDLAKRAQSLGDASIGMSLVFAGTPQPQGLVSGTVCLAIAKGDDAARLLTPLQARSTLAEVQRRSGLHAADMLRQELYPVASPA
ncbi:MAG: CinA family nicotinamide mononucleotide deamidase-related protein [Chloroflexota bacterium]|nr:CinA family nicotinamide mononucleotide deamidase-related protein [Chloroflexota bacterium]